MKSSREIVIKCPLCGTLNRRYRIYIYKDMLIRCDKCQELFKVEKEVDECRSMSLRNYI